jgi:long-chain acyl-CoA synthetase
MGNCVFCAKKWPGVQQIKYNVPLVGQSTPAEGESQIYRNQITTEGPLFVLGGTLQDIYDRNVREYPNEPFLGTRQRNASTGELADFTYKTWAEMDVITKKLGSGIINLDLAPVLSEFEDYSLRFIALYAGNVPEWIYTDHAANCYGFTTIPMFNELHPVMTSYIFRKTNVQTVFTTSDHLPDLSAMLRSEDRAYRCIKNVVVLQDQEYSSLPATSDIRSAADELVNTHRIRVITFSDVCKAGEERPQPMIKTKPKHIFSLYYTSGTTGEPKAAMLESGAFYTNLAALFMHPSKPDAFKHAKGNLNALQIGSFGHIAERMFSWNCAMLVSRYCLNSVAPHGYMYFDRLYSDLVSAKPSVIFSQPWFWNHLYHTILDDIEKTWFLKRWLIKKAIATKLELLQENYLMHSFWDWLVLGHFRSYLGGTATTGLSLMMTGAAPINSSIKEFIMVVMSRPMTEIYAQTECHAQGFITIPHHCANPDHNGGIGYASEFKLIDVPELGYHVTHKDQDGNLAPRGEILLRGPCIFPGYYKDPEQTAEAIDKDGWIHTADIGLLCPNRANAMRLIDRRGHFFKLKKGQWVTLDRIEQLYKNCKGVKNFWIYGENTWDHLIAVVNVYPQQFMEICADSGVKGDDWLKMIDNEQAVKVFLKELEANVKRDNVIADFEIVAGVIIEPESFMDLGVYTESGKIKRRALAARYKDQIEKLHKK